MLSGCRSSTPLSPSAAPRSPLHTRTPSPQCAATSPTQTLQPDVLQLHCHVQPADSPVTFGCPSSTDPSPCAALHFRLKVV